MLQLFETICYQNGVFQRVSLHEERLNFSRKELFGTKDWIPLIPYLVLPEALKNSKVKCKISYGLQITGVEFQIYCPRTIRNLSLVFDDKIDYKYKYTDRFALEELAKTKQHSDEIVIVKNNKITDTSFSNIIFWKHGKWYTPDQPLLNGTRRLDYIKRGKIFPIPIMVNDLYKFEKAKLINAMLAIEETDAIDIKLIT